MLEVILGVGLLFYGVSQNVDVEPAQPHEIFYEYPQSELVMNERVASETTLRHVKYKNLTRQQYDYSCGSAALTTLFNNYFNHGFREDQVMQGLIKFGERERIVEDRNFSFLDMKRLSNALGYAAGGFKAEYKDIKELDKPAIIPIEYAGFSHFVVVKAAVDGHVFVADPSLGNISFTEKRFNEIWKKKVLFLVFPKDGQVPTNKFQYDESQLRLIEDAAFTPLTLAHLTQPDVFDLEQERDEIYTRFQLPDNFDKVIREGSERLDEYSERIYFNNK